MKESYRNKLHYWLRFSGWFSLVPASIFLYLYQATQGTEFGNFYLAELIITVLFGVYVLTTSKLEKWEKTSKILSLAIFSFIFVSIVEFIPVFMAYQNCRKLNNLENTRK